MPCSSLLGALLRSICAASLLVPAQLSAAEPSEAPPNAAPPDAAPPDATEPPAAGEIGDASQDELREAMVRAFAERFQEGEFLFNRGQYTQAAAEFERAFAAIAAEAALRNVVLSYERAGDRVSAALAARRYLALPSCDTPKIEQALCSKYLTKIEEQYERLMAQIGELTLQVDKGVDLREISINNRKIAIADFPLLVAPGRIDVELVGGLPGQRRQRVIDVRPGEQQAIRVGPFDAPDTVPPGGGRTPRERPKWLKPLFWSGLGITIASGAAMATMGGLLLREQRLYHDNLCDTDPMTPQPDCPMDGKDHYPHGHAHRVDQYKLATNVLIGVTAGLAMITTVVGLFAFTGDGKRGKRNGGTQRASTRLRWTGAGVLVRW